MKIVLVLRTDLTPALAANAAVVLGLALGGRLDGSVAVDSADASGAPHAGLNPVPVPTLVASGRELHVLHEQAQAAADVTVAGNVVQYSLWNGANQQWQLVRVG